MMDKRTKTGVKSMTDNETEGSEVERKPGIGYLLLHRIMPFLLQMPDAEAAKRNFFTPLDNEDEEPLKNLFLGLCKTAAEMADGRKYDFESEADNQALAETPGFLLLYLGLQIYTIVELKDKTRIYIWEFPAPMSVPDPHVVAVALLPGGSSGGEMPIRYIVLESSYFGAMLCEWAKKGQDGECHMNYGNCENDIGVFLDRVLNLLGGDRGSVESIKHHSLLEGGGTVH